MRCVQYESAVFKLVNLLPILGLWQLCPVLPEYMSGLRFCHFIPGSPWIIGAGSQLFTFPGQEEENYGSFP